MLKETLKSKIPVFSGADINHILDLAQKSHENYLIRSNRNDLDKALVYYLEAMKINPSIPHVYYKLASLLWEKGDIDLTSAIQKCKKAIELDPKSANARLYLGYFLKASGNYKEAEKWLNGHDLKIRVSKKVYVNPKVDLFAEQLDYKFYNLILTAEKIKK